MRNMMTERLSEAECRQLCELVELAQSGEGVLAAERHLTLLFGRRPSLRELVDELLERRRARLAAVEPEAEGVLAAW